MILLKQTRVNAFLSLLADASIFFLYFPNLYLYWFFVFFGIKDDPFQQRLCFFHKNVFRRYVLEDTNFNDRVSLMLEIRTYLHLNHQKKRGGGGFDGGARS